MNNIVDAIFLERRKELRLISNVMLDNGEKIVFSVSANNTTDVQEILNKLDIKIKFDSQMIDAGTR
jgi:ethanolamine utilization protein EutP (predicted NTPase)